MNAESLYESMKAYEAKFALFSAYAYAFGRVEDIMEENQGSPSHKVKQIQTVIDAMKMYNNTRKPDVMTLLNSADSMSEQGLGGRIRSALDNRNTEVRDILKKYKMI